MVAQPPVKPVPTTAEVASHATGGKESWAPSSWRTKLARQLPKYDDPELVSEVEGILSRQAPLVFAGEVCFAARRVWASDNRGNESRGEQMAGSRSLRVTFPHPDATGFSSVSSVEHSELWFVSVVCTCPRFFFITLLRRTWWMGTWSDFFVSSFPCSIIFFHLYIKVAEGTGISWLFVCQDTKRYFLDPKLLTAGAGGHLIFFPFFAKSTSCWN